jgi:hypothetical protein
MQATKTPALPSERFPSDHLSIMAAFQLLPPSQS